MSLSAADKPTNLSSAIDPAEANRFLAELTLLAVDNTTSLSKHAIAPHSSRLICFARHGRYAKYDRLASHYATDAPH
jgi:hypothetical protein